MTDNLATTAYQDAGSQRLNNYQRNLVDGLAAVIDVEAGLEEILLQSRNDASVDSLITVLDEQAGLQEILSRSRHDAPKGSAFVPFEDTGSQGTALTDTGTDLSIISAVSEASSSDIKAALVLATTNAHTRIRVRTHPEVAAACNNLARIRTWAYHLRLDRDPGTGLLGALDLTCHLTNGLANSHRLSVALHDALRSALGISNRYHYTLILGHALEQARGEFLVFMEGSKEWEINTPLGQGPALGRALILGRILDLAIALSFSLQRQHQRDLILDRVLARARAIEKDMDEVRRALKVALQQHIPSRINPAWVDAFLDDFTTSDLRTTDLSDVDLEGVRWSESGTLWPAAMDIEDLKIRSEETFVDSGIYVIRSGANTASAACP
ncbi:hypothetical protein [Streptomyces sp. SBT349]|uniref:hypothetical protein n=1 Tax=Streptomyces sp. SBT349 TaxID=1580539 RepID=UPI00066E9379|nr:hypothetical protein [Streptomyces sp. SBT349]